METFITYLPSFCMLIGCVLIIVAVGIHRKRDRVRQCTARTAGLIVHIDVDKNGYGETVKVKYCVGDRKYFVTEKIKYKAVKGQSGKVPVMGRLKRGDQVTVRFNPKKHTDAYIAENKGIFA